MDVSKDGSFLFSSWEKEESIRRQRIDDTFPFDRSKLSCHFSFFFLPSFYPVNLVFCFAYTVVAVPPKRKFVVSELMESRCGDPNLSPATTRIKDIVMAAKWHGGGTAGFFPGVPRVF